MSEPTPVLKALRDELLKQNGTTAVGAEMDRLRRIVESQQRRARRLTWWTVGVWAVWFTLIVLYFALPILSRTDAPPRPRPATPDSTASVDQPRAETDGTVAAMSATRPAAPVTTRPATAPTVLYRGRPPIHPVAALFGVLLLGFTFAGPFIGLVLLVLTVLARRTAGMSEIRASLASIDAQLRLLAMSRPNPPEGPAAAK